MKFAKYAISVAFAQVVATTRQLRCLLNFANSGGVVDLGAEGRKWL